MLSGARIGEIAQLRPQDIREEESVWVIDINDEEGRRLKTHAARRLVPVHPELVRLGLLELAARRRATRQASLLPDMPKPVLGDPGKQPSKWMSEKFLPKHGLKRPLLGFHSFRHSLRTLLREARMEERYADYMYGHHNAAVGNIYGGRAFGIIAEDLARIRVPESLKRIPPRAASGKDDAPSEGAVDGDDDPEAEQLGSRA